MSDIPDEAVQAVERVLDEPGSPVGWDVPRAVIRQALEAALPHLYPSAVVRSHMEALARIEELEDGIRELIGCEYDEDKSCDECRSLLIELLPDDDRYPTSKEDADG